jgi:hypothetical protein
MDFIERLFHQSPDAGSGATEIMIMAVLVTITIICAFRLRRRGERAR